ncbi:hypothetical protein HYT56_01565 [Candidatus Woesearchaeota archaeon]|nr:hypothetical protein [Candidatus Woesearchaeota archaeon]
MNILDKITDDFISEIIGKDVLNLLQYLRKKSNVSEFKLAEKLNITVNQTRNMLYRLYSYSLVDFTRKKDKKKGWYIYYWDFYPDRALNVALTHKNKRLEILKNLLKKEETGQYFSCPDNDVRFLLEQAIEHGFKCPECDKVLVQENNTRKIQNMMRTIDELEKEINEVNKILTEKREEELKKIEASKKRDKRKLKKPIRRIVKKTKTKRKKPAKKKPKKTLKKKVSKRKTISKHSKRKFPKKIFKKKAKRKLKK